MTEREVLKLALEAFEWNYNTDLDNIPAYEKWAKMLKENITAIREALAQSEQEPVVWMYQNKSTHEVRFQKHMRSFVDHGAWYEVPLYSEPLANQEKTSGSPKPAKTEALRLADAMEYDLDWCDEAAAELRRMHDLLGKANALCRIRAEEIERLKAQPEPVIDKSAAIRIATSLGWEPKRTWVGLTDEELETINDCGDTDSYKFARAIEAKLKEKNN